MEKLFDLLKPNEKIEIHATPDVIKIMYCDRSDAIDRWALFIYDRPSKPWSTFKSIEDDSKYKDLLEHLRQKSQTK